MGIKDSLRPKWKTSSFGRPPETTPAELSALRTHLDQCKQSRGRLFTLRRVVERMDGLVVRYLITIVVVVFLAILLMMLVTSQMH
ncbi:MAG: hypothetical protein ABI702_19195 [Burkholderiales bacterium]